MTRRDKIILNLDVLLCARRPRTRTRLMNDACVSFTSICKILPYLVNEGYLDKAESTRARTTDARTARRDMGLDPWDASPYGKHWYKTTKVGEEFISNMKELWELAGRDHEQIGMYPFDYTGGVGGMEPPVKNRYYGGLDPDWVANIYIPPIKFRSDMKIGILK